MDRFRSYLLEAAVVDNLIADLAKAGYSKVTKKTSTVLLVYVPKSDINVALPDIESKLNGTWYKRSSSISSKGYIYWESGTYSKFKVAVKPDAAKSLSTDQQETLAGIFIATKLHHPATDYSLEELKKHGDPHTQSKFGAEQLYLIAGKGWLQSSQTVAETIYPKLKPRKYEVQQRSNSKFVDNISKTALKLIRDAGKRMGLDKWNPSDIWLVDKAFVNYNFSQFTSIIELNDWLRKQFDAGKVIGVSLKQVDKKAKVETYNYEKRDPVEVTGWDVGKTGFVSALNGTIYHSAGSMIIRNFGRPENVSGEINGRLAQGGKVGAGELFSIFREHDSSFSTKSKQEIMSMFDKDQKKVYEHLYSQMEKLDPSSYSKYTLEKFMEEVEAKQNRDNYIISKWQVSDIMTSLKEMSKEKQSQLINDMISYASSSTEISSVFYKVS